MQIAAKTNLLLTEPSSFKLVAEAPGRFGYAELYQEISLQIIRCAHSNRVFAGLANTLINVAEQAYSLRQMETVENASRVLLNLPLTRGHNSAGVYFGGVCATRRSELESARALLEHVADQPRHAYTARALQSLGVVFHAQGDLESAMKLYVDAGRCAAESGRDISPALFASWSIAVLKGADGDHRGALASLQQMNPLARSIGGVYPAVLFNHVNSVAVELMQTGNLGEARRASQIALASPFASAYPEWRETFDEIAFKQRRASRSFVAVPIQLTHNTPPQEREPAHKTSRCNRPPTSNVLPQQAEQVHNLIRWPVPLRAGHAAPADQSSKKTKGRLLAFPQPKTAPQQPDPLLPGKLNPQQREQLTTGEKLIRLMDLISRDDTEDETIARILDAVEEIVLGGPELPPTLTGA